MKKVQIYPFKRSYSNENGRNRCFSTKTNSEVIGADATSMEDLGKLFDAAIAKFGKIDFILHSIGMSVNVRKGKHYTDINYDC